MQFKASTETDTLMRKYGLVLRLNPDGFEVYTSNSQPLETSLTYITQVSGQTAFEFVGITTDPNFYYFTDIPMNEVGFLNYSSDQTATDASNTSIQLTENFVQEAASQHAMKITIQFDDLIKLYNNTTIAYSIALQARETQWNYYIINNSNQEYNQLEIQSTDENIQFSGSTAVTLQNGQNALLFSSQTTKIPLKNEVTYTFNLISTKKTIAGERKEIVVKGLPIPNPQNLQVQDDHTIASLMYVYI
jgi:hypothetical protein